MKNASTGRLSIISPDGVFFEGKMLSVIIPAPDGQIELLPYHEAMMTAVSVGELKYRTDDGQWHTVSVGGGVGQVANNRCQIFVNSVERPEEIDRNRARAALERATEHLRQKKSIEEYKLSQAAMARALNRLRVSDREPY
ncbi:MAG: ATP synthase F1 subunit epsilon [Lachnospiraceae bacterium]|nr:ATP synthase F1 subunit epsilon [Lachnospiraceae bacterium]MBR1876310.1 ATP synthase F1 subunit epsilon [Lachnospiraceae bacterium]